MSTFVDNLSDLAFQGSFHFLLSWAIGVCALVIASRVFASFHLFLPIFPPIVPVLWSSLLSNWLRWCMVTAIIRLESIVAVSVALSVSLDRGNLRGEALVGTKFRFHRSFFWWKTILLGWFLKTPSWLLSSQGLFLRILNNSKIIKENPDQRNLRKIEIQNIQ